MIHGKLVIGLIGGIGSGKSRVASAFAGRGGRVVSGDEAGHAALKAPRVRDRVVVEFGRGIVGPDGEIERKKLGAIVFSDGAALRRLEAIVFPWIGNRLREEIETAAQNPDVRFIVLDAAVMLEAGWNNVCDRLVYVHAPREARLERLARQRGWNEKEVEARERAQLSLTEKATRADAAVDNSGPPEQLTEQIDRLLREWGVTRDT